MPSVDSQLVVSAILQQLKEARLARGYSQETLAGLSGVDLGVISRAERELRVPGLASLLDISTALELNFAKVVREAEKSVADQ